MRAWSAIDQAELARRAGVSRRVIQQAESGEICTDRTWTRILAAFGVIGLAWQEGPPPTISFTASS